MRRLQPVTLRRPPGFGRADLTEAVRRSREVAATSYRTAGNSFSELERALKAFNAALEKAEALHSDLRAGKKHESLQKAVAPFLEKKRRHIQARFRDLVEAHERRREQLDEFTVMFFGRTMVGKSTTIEAIIAGDGSTIGNGGPDTTKEIDGFRTDGLLLVDTPGLLGFKPELHSVAESYITRADLVCMVLSDDSIEPVLFECMRELLGQHKRLLVLLNVKSATRPIERGEPEEAYDAREIGEQTAFIRQQLDAAFPGLEVPIIPYCAHAAFLARQEPDGTRSEHFWKHSRIDDVMAVIAQVVLGDGLAIRATAPFDALAYFAQDITEDLEEDLPAVRRQVPELRRKREEARRMFQRVIADSASELAGLKSHFQKVNDKLHDLAGEIVRGELDESPAKAFKRVVRWKDVNDQVAGFQHSVVKRITRNVEHFRDSLLSDLVAAVELEDEMADVPMPGFDDQKWKKQVARGLRVGAPVAGALGGWGGAELGAAVGSFGGPIGSAIGFFVGGLLGAWLGSSAAETVAEGLEEDAERSLRGQHRDLRERMKDQLWSSYRDLNDRLYKWMKKTTEKTHVSIDDMLVGFADALDALVRATDALLRVLHGQRQILTYEAFRVLLSNTHPAFRQGQVELVAATQWMRFRTKLVVRGADGRPAVGRVVGRGGDLVKGLRRHGGTAIDIVESAPELTATMVVEALRPARLDPSMVTVGERVRVRVPPSQIGPAKGRHQRNLQLARELLGRSIDLVVAPNSCRSDTR